MMPRHALHRRSDSDTNVRMGGASGSAKPQDVSQFPSRSTSSSTKNSKRHKKQSSTNSSTTGTTTSRSNTVRSYASLDSLPPVPPLRIQKQRMSSLGVFQDSNAATNSYTLGGTHAADSHANHIDEPQNPPVTPPRAPPLPRSILKKPSKTALPPYTEDDYRRQSSAWVGSQTFDFTPNRARMNAQTLRLVNDDGTEVPDRYAGERADYLGESSAQGQLRIQTRPSVRRSRSASASDMLSPSSTRPTTPPQARQFPDWARYFYGKKGGRTSVIVPTETNDQVGLAISSPEERPRTAGSMSIAEIPRYFMRSYRPRDADATTLWSLPHLDRAPMAHVEKIDRQLILFCFGFILPICWWVASFLPLPSLIPPFNGDVEARAADLPISKEARKTQLAYERRHEYARWWRRVNRALSVIGLLIIGAVVALVLTSR